jgi:hypothetical protein
MKQAQRIFAGLLGLLALTGPAWADTAVEVWDTKLNVTKGTLQGVSGSIVSYFDEGRAYQTLSRDAVVRLRVVPKVVPVEPAPVVKPVEPAAVNPGLMRWGGGAVIKRNNRGAQPAAPAEPEKPKEVKLDGPGWLWLTDGQKIKATLKGPAQGETVGFTSDRLGAFNVPVDKIAKFWPEALAEGMAATDGQDTLLLANGDKVVGFVETLDETGFKFKPTGAEVAAQLAPGQVAGFWLSNPLAGPGVGVTVFTLLSGDVLGASDLKVADDKAQLTLAPVKRVPAGEAPAEPLEVALTDVATIDFSGTGGRLVALKDVPRQAVAGQEFLGTPNLPVESPQGTLLQAPVTVRFMLPPGSARLLFNGSAWSAKGSETQARKWTHFEASIKLAGQNKPVWSMPFEFGKSERVLIGVLPGPLDLSLDDGPDGPVLDRFLISDAYLLVKPTN